MQVLAGNVRTSLFNFTVMNIVITGATKGIGRAVGQRFAEDKQGHCFFLCARNNKALEELQREWTDKCPGIDVRVQACDLGNTGELKNFTDWILKQTDRVDILVNNAGLFIPGNVHDEEDGLLEKIMQINLFAPYHLTRRLLTAMIKHKSGHIFNIASIAALQAYPGGGAYGISKFALDGFSKNLRHEMKGHGIKVTVVHPGATYTDSWKSSGISPDRFMKAEDIAQMIYAASQVSPQACVEEIIIRPQLGDL
jgi:short-subunit dehydrogenase